jgi:ATP-dependent RNA helicase RhlE
MSTFADLGVSKAVVDVLGRDGFTHPLPVQELVIGDVLAGSDVLVRSPTGSGKTLAFAIPLVERLGATDARPAALILAPTRELVSQIAEEMRNVAHARALSVSAVYGGVGLQKQAREAARAHIVVATPGRLEDLLDRGAFSLKNVRVLILDEADRMLDMGFRPAVDRIVARCPADRQTLFLSATLEGESGRVAESYTDRPVRREYTPAPDPNALKVEHRFVEVDSTERLPVLMSELGRERDLALVFVRTKRGADRLVKRLGTEGVEAVAMHGDKTQGQRERALARFERGHVTTLVATDVAARGIDVDRISHVINYDVPEDRDAYVHRVGRTGRAGRGGIGVTFVAPAERGAIARIAEELGIHHGLGHTSTRSPHSAPRGGGGSRNGGGGSRNGGGGSRNGGGGSRNGGGSRGSSASHGGGSPRIVASSGPPARGSAASARRRRTAAS